MTEKQYSEMTTEQIELEVDELANLPSVKKSRIWEIDFLRGILIFLVVMDHFFWDVFSIGGGSAGQVYQTNFMQWLHTVAVGYQTKGSFFGELRSVFHDFFVYMFVLISGISCSFSRDNTKRGIRMVCFAFLFSACTFAASSIFHQDLTIAFNIIHTLSLSVLIFSLVDLLGKKADKAWQKNLFGAVIFAIIIVTLLFGFYYTNYPYEPEGEKSWLVFLVKTYGAQSWFSPGDYWPLLPSLGIFFGGAFLGRVLYKEKTTLFPSVNAKYVSPFTFMGRYSIWFYFGTQIVMFGLIYLFTIIVPVL